MFTCFESIPQEIRQEAFNRFVEGDILHGLSEALNSTVPPQTALVYNHVCCPFGAVNRVIERRLNAYAVIRNFPPGYINIPDGGKVESDILASVGITVDPDEAQKFIWKNDHDAGFLSFEELAEAMGAVYNP
jgi:hypothetical protein